MEKASGSGPFDFPPFSSEFDPERLERGAQALREIAASKEAKKAFELMKKQKETRQTTDIAAKATEFKAMQAQSETVRQRVIIYDEQIKLAQQQAQIESQMHGRL